MTDYVLVSGACHGGWRFYERTTSCATTTVKWYAS